MNYGPACQDAGSARKQPVFSDARLEAGEISAPLTGLALGALHEPVEDVAVSYTHLTLPTKA